MKLIPNFPGYSITTDGKVYSHFKFVRGKDGKVIDRVIDYSYSKIMKPQLKAEEGRSQIRPHLILRKNGKRYKVNISRLVALTYLPNPHKYPSVLHKNDISTDNRLENLMWGTNRVNVRQREQNQKKDLLIQQLQSKIEQLERKFKNEKEEENK
jgi:hypothetical protein